MGLLPDHCGRSMFHCAQAAAATAGGATPLGNRGSSCREVSHIAPQTWQHRGALSSTADLQEEKCEDVCIRNWDKTCFLGCHCMEWLNVWPIEMERGKARERQDNVCSFPSFGICLFMFTSAHPPGERDCWMLQSPLGALLTRRLTLPILRVCWEDNVHLY